MMQHFADKLLKAIEEKGAPVCVGLDPVWERLPLSIRESFDQGGEDPGAEKAAALLTYCDEIIQIVAPMVPAVKINIAFFESHHPGGLLAYFEAVKAAIERDLIVIGDVKRGDIGHTSAMYAHAHLSDPPVSESIGRPSDSVDPEDMSFPEDWPRPDAITINPYFGLDGVEPFLSVCKDEGKGVFILAQTSNASAGQVQGLKLADGRTVREAVGGLIHEWATSPGLVGRSGYSSVGAVVSPTDVEATRRLRSIMPQSIFLVPGFGAQGRTGSEVSACFNTDGLGAIVSSSRGVMFPWTLGSPQDEAPKNWRAAVAEACAAFVQEVRKAVQT